MSNENNEKISRDWIPFIRQDIPVERAITLAKLIVECEKYDIKIEKISFFLNGFQVVFEGFKGDVILHDCSLGRERLFWESYRFPWDNDGVSVNSTEALVALLRIAKTVE